MTLKDNNVIHLDAATSTKNKSWNLNHEWKILFKSFNTFYIKLAYFRKLMLMQMRRIFTVQRCPKYGCELLNKNDQQIFILFISFKSLLNLDNPHRILRNIEFKLKCRDILKVSFFLREKIFFLKTKYFIIHIHLSQQYKNYYLSHNQFSVFFK